ncbi:DeoR family transcriptional regulator, myo-inositol catabolism operon repressor [Enterococcus sp. AZ194]|uniref:DeoR/GlpR family DNA-binding transcription regulator n=1 Tax=Enterococcus sp. AZ194 TaxID=2774629 RepID=UPI003F2439B9
MKSKRIDEIEAYVIELGNVSFDDLSKKFKVSLNTLRRDINELIKKGNIEKVYGGVRSIQGRLIDYKVRNITNSSAKRKIGEIAATLIEEGDVIYIDSGTTTVQLLTYLNPTTRCTILTNNFDVIEFCTYHPNLELIVLGSHYKFSTRSFVELSYNQELTSVNINKAFMAATGIGIKNGATNSDVLEQQIKKAICQRSREIYLLADHTKFGHTTLMTYSLLEDFHTIISDKTPSSDFLDFFEENDIRFLTEKK